MRVKATGPVPCDLAIIGPYPGYVENRTGLAFTGKVGEELDRYLDGESLPTRACVYLDNLYTDYIDYEHEYTAEEYKIAAPDLLTRLERVKPKTIVAMGREVARLFLGDVDITDVEGIPWIDPTITGRVIFPLVHIAAGMRNAELSPFVVRGFQQLSLFLQGKIAPRLLFDDPIKEPVYEEITTPHQLEASLKGLREGQSLGIDCEGWPSNAWSVQYSFIPGTGYLIRRPSQDLLKRFDEIISRIRPTLAFHSALVDRNIGRSLNLGLDRLAFDDTMVMAYLLQLEGQGLKAGCLRHCGMKMDSYDDIMGDVQNELARDYLTWLFDSEQENYEEARQAEFIRLTTTPYLNKNGKRVQGRRLSSLPKLPKTSLHKAVTRVLQSKRPRGLWLEQNEDIQVAGCRRLGAVPEATLDYIEPSRAIHYATRDADGTGRLLPKYSQRIDAMGLRSCYELELSTYPLIDRMQRVGIKPDLEHFAVLSRRLELEISSLQRNLSTSTGVKDFNANSGDQVAEYLFNTLGLEELKWTKGDKDGNNRRGSTNDKILEALEHEHPEHPIISTIRAYRETYKLKHTFVDRLPDFVQVWPYDGRIHATFRTTRVVTGRLAASDPNLLAQPEHGKFAPDFKRGWVAEDGHVLCQWDESQVELRGLAHLSQDPVLLHAFRTGQDLHAQLAVRIFGGKESDYYGKCYQRFAVKEINFGIPMGFTRHGLRLALRSKGIETDEDTAQRWLDETLELYAGVRTYMRNRIEEAGRNGYVRCLSGRIRYIGGIRSHDDRTREEAERFAFSTPIQESATFIMKQAEATIYEDILVPYWRQGRWVEPLLQVHDSIKLEAEKGMEDELNEVMTEAMTQVPKSFSVPLVVEGEYGPNLADMVPYD